MNPYQEIRKVPLNFNGIQSAAYAVQRLYAIRKQRSKGNSR